MLLTELQIRTDGKIVERNGGSDSVFAPDGTTRKISYENARSANGGYTGGQLFGAFDKPGGHWFEPSTATLESPVHRGFFFCGTARR